MSEQPFFSVIVVDYEGSVTREQFRQKMACLAAQTCDDFEVIVLHDGPKATSYEEDIGDAPRPANMRFIITDTRANDWGHSNRDRGIREAKGTWIVNTNADNIFRPTLIERLKEAALDRTPIRLAQIRVLPVGIKSIAKRIDRWFGTNLLGMNVTDVVERQILIYAVVMVGIVPRGSGAMRLRDAPDGYGIVYGGVPVQPGNIDLMQFVMRRDLWLAEGGWSNTHENSDGFLYKRFARKYDVVVVPEILGEHW